MRLTPPRSPPARPLTVSCAARHGMEEENQRQKRVARCACLCICRAEPMLGLLLEQAAEHGLGSTKPPKQRGTRRSRVPLNSAPITSSTHGVDLLIRHWNLSEVGRVGFAGMSAAWMRLPSLHGRIHGVPRESNPPRQTRQKPRAAFDVTVAVACRRQRPRPPPQRKPLRSSSPATRPGRCSCPGSSPAGAASHPPAAPALARTHASTRP